MVAIFSTIARPRNIIGIIVLIWFGFKLIRQMQKTPNPTVNTVNKHNSKILVLLKEDFLSHENEIDNQTGNRYKFFEGFFNLLIIVYDVGLGLISHKYDWDNYFARRLNYWLRKWKESDWVDDGKFPETQWNLTEADKQEPTYKRQQALKVAIDNEEWAKVLNLVE